MANKNGEGMGSVARDACPSPPSSRGSGHGGRLALLIFTLIGVQFARVIGENVAMVRQLSTVRADVAALQKHRAEQRREMRRLRDPEGADPRDPRPAAPRAPERNHHLRQPRAVVGSVTESIDGIVINLNAYGATVRLENGDLATALEGDVEAHRADYQRSLVARRELHFELRREGRRPVVVLAPQIRDDVLDERIA